MTENTYITSIDLNAPYTGTMIMTFPRCCKWCMWHDEFSWVCSNGRSPYCADFTDEDCTCEYWEREV